MNLVLYTAASLLFSESHKISVFYQYDERERTGEGSEKLQGGRTCGAWLLKTRSYEVDSAGTRSSLHSAKI